MPLHDWNDDRGWDSVHPLWVAELVRWLHPRLPAGYRVYLASVPALSIGGEEGRPDLAVRDWQEPSRQPPPESPWESSEPDLQTVATFPADPQSAVHVTRRGQLVTAVELVSPRNKDRPSARELYRNRYLGYLNQGAHLLLIDVHRRPLNFSFADALAAELQSPQPLWPPPHAVTYRIGGPTPEGGRFLDVWRRPLNPGQPLPTVPLPLAEGRPLRLDLETTYVAAAALAYLPTQPD